MFHPSVVNQGRFATALSFLVAPSVVYWSLNVLEMVCNPWSMQERYSHSLLSSPWMRLVRETMAPGLMYDMVYLILEKPPNWMKAWMRTCHFRSLEEHSVLPFVSCHMRPVSNIWHVGRFFRTYSGCWCEMNSWQTSHLHSTNKMQK